MAAFDLSPEKQAEWTRKYREAAAPYVDGEIESIKIAADQLKRNPWSGEVLELLER